MLTATHSTPADRRIPELALKVCFALAVLHVVFLPTAYFAGMYIFDRNGLGDPTDFVTIWSAGRLALEGQVAAVYDWDLHKQAQVAILGQSYEGHFGWHYPPPYLFIVTVLSCVPYAIAYPLYAVLSFLPFLATIRAIVGRPVGLLLAFGFPVVLINIWISQNGFLTAALLGGALLFMPVRPVLAGICLGLLTYKPQYGVLFPIVLIATQQWRVFITASVVAIAVGLASWAAFGDAGWIGFLHSLTAAEQAFLSEGRAPWGKMQSIFATVRYFGGGEQAAWIAQIAMTLAVTIGVTALWRSSVRYSLKAAALAAGAILAIPYVFLYDVMVLAVAVAFLVRDGLRFGFRAYEWPLFALAFFLLFIFLGIGAPTGFAATLVIVAIIAGRCAWPDTAAWRASPPRPSPELQSQS
jgi:arabinofuranan 3-O-arabinosyltransferase